MAISTIGASGLNSAVSQIGKNLVHNGELTVSQRALPITGLGAGSGYTFDRWKYESSGSPTGRHTVSRGTGILNAASSLRIDVTTADSSLASNALYQMTQKIEAQDLHFLEFGSATAKAFTISFTMKSNFDGAFTLYLIAADGSRSYARPINLTGDESQETFECTIPGDTSGAFNFDNGVGLDLMITLAAGSGFAGGTQNAWAASNNNMYGASNSGNFFSSTDNYVEFSLVQLEVGSVATDFEHETIGVTLAKCQRWFYRLQESDTNSLGIGSGGYMSTTLADVLVAFPVEMRAAPTMSVSAVGDFKVQANSQVNDSTGMATVFAGSTLTSVLRVTTGSAAGGEGVVLRTDGSAGGFIQYSAEI